MSSQVCDRQELIKQMTRVTRKGQGHCRGDLTTPTPQPNSAPYSNKISSRCSLTERKQDVQDGRPHPQEQPDHAALPEDVPHRRGTRRVLFSTTTSRQVRETKKQQNGKGGRHRCVRATSEGCSNMPIYYRTSSLVFFFLYRQA